MAYEALRKKKEELTDIQQKYLDILIEEYGGFVPYGEKPDIAERIGCSVKTLYALDNGTSPNFNEARRRRLRDFLPLADSMVQIAKLQWLFDESIEARKKANKPITSKDPVDILEQIRKTSESEVHISKLEATQNIDQSTHFNFEGVSDEELSRMIQSLTNSIREGDTLPALENVVEGEVVEQ